jgi:GT2 family glycosyltransferase
MTDDPSRRERELVESLRSAREESELWRREAEALQAELRALRATRTFRYSASARHFYAALRRRLSAQQRNYAAWAQAFDVWSDQDLRRLAQRVSRIQSPPIFSVIVPTYDTPEPFLRSAIDSVLGQTYSQLELCVADDHSHGKNVRRILEEYANRDRRVKLIFRSENGGIAKATNSALSLAEGDWVVFLDHDDVLPAHALARIAIEADEHPSTQLIYTDEDHIDEHGRRFGPMFKSEFDPVLLLSYNYVCHLLAIRTAAVSRAGGLRVGFDGSQDYDLILRVIEGLKVEEIQHIPEVLYHWRAHPRSTAYALSAKSYALNSSRQAVVEHLDRTGRKGEVITRGTAGQLRVRWSLPGTLPSATIIIPTRDGEYLVRCLDSVRKMTTYPRYDVIVVDNGSQREATLRYLGQRAAEEPQRIQIIRDDGSFNYSRLNNLAVSKTSAEVVCLLNDDTEVLGAAWLDELVSEVTQPGVGVAGAKLYYPDGRIQHAGMVVGMGGGAGHIFRGADGNDEGYCGLAAVTRSVSAVTGACMAVRREAWESVGGLDERELKVTFNDVDLCLRLYQAGWRVVWTPYAKLSHVDAATRGPDTDTSNSSRSLREWAAFSVRWGDPLPRDPYYSPNLSLEATDCSLAWPPRVERLGQQRLVTGSARRR